MEKSKIAKVTMSLEAEALLNQMVARSNDGFTGGKVTKHDLLSWVVTCFAESYFERNVERIQNDHFDRLAHLDNLVKRIKSARSKGIADHEAESLLKQIADASAKQKPERSQKQAKQPAEAA